MPTALVLASGRGERFLASGGTTHKLQALLGAKTVLQHTLDAVCASGLPWHLEDGGHAGMGDSIAAAVRATPQASGWLVVLGDLPLIQAATLQALAQALSLHDVVIPTYQGQRGHPVGFSARCRESLLNLSGDKGAASVVKIFGGMDYEARRFYDAANKVRRLGMKQAAASSANSAMGELVAALMLALIVYLVARQSASNETTARTTGTRRKVARSRPAMQRAFPRPPSTIFGASCRHSRVVRPRSAG